MKKLSFNIIVLFFVFSDCHSQSQVSFGLGLGKSLKGNHGFSYGGQVNISSSLDSLHALTVGLGYSQSNKYSEVKAYSFGLGVDFYMNQIFNGFHIGPFMSLGLQNPGKYKLLTFGLDIGHMANLGGGFVLNPNFGIGYTAVLGFSESNALGVSGVLSLGHIF